MITDEKIEDEKHNKILTKTLQNQQHYQQAKLLNMNILQGKKYYILIKSNDKAN